MTGTEANKMTWARRRRRSDCGTGAFYISAAPAYWEVSFYIVNFPRFGGRSTPSVPDTFERRLD